MNFDQKLKKYAELTVRTGANVQLGQELILQCSVENAAFGRMVAESAYEAGAKVVWMAWNDDRTARLNYDYSPLEVFENPPEFVTGRYNYCAKVNGALINILSRDPEIFKGVESAKLLAATKAQHEATKEFDAAMDRNELQWNIVAVPSVSWARKVFPGLPDEEAVEKLWEAIFKAVRLDEEDPVAAWQTHSRTLSDKAAFLNEQQFESLHYTNSIGTDFTVGLVKGHIWAGGSGKSASGVEYFPNMPTEEVFTMPHLSQAEGRVVSSMPLSYQGTLIRDFSLTFKEGKVTDFTAKEGREALELLLNTDEGSRHLGEVALVPHHSPISDMGILFYNTLFDENASCHLALGACYPDTLQGGTELSKEELKQKGGNDSINHVDFMVGTADLKITGKRSDGSEVVVFENGNWAV